MTKRYHGVDVKHGVFYDDEREAMVEYIASLTTEGYILAAHTLTPLFGSDRHDVIMTLVGHVSNQRFPIGVVEKVDKRETGQTAFVQIDPYNVTVEEYAEGKQRVYLVPVEQW